MCFLRKFKEGMRGNERIKGMKVLLFVFVLIVGGWLNYQTRRHQP